MANKKKKILEEALKMHEAAGGTYSSPEAAAKQQYANARHETAKNAYNQESMAKAAERKREAEAAKKKAERIAQTKQQVRTEAEETKTALSTYMQSDERKQKEEAHKKQELSRFTQQLLGGNADIMQPQMLRDEKEAQLRKEADKAGKTQTVLENAQASQERARETTSTEEADLAEIQAMTPEERRQLDEYIFNREQKFYSGFDPTKSDLMMPQMPVVSPLEQKYGKKRLDELAESQSRKNQREISEKALQDAAASAGGSGWDAVGHSALAVLAGASSGIGKGLDYLKDKAMGTGRYDGMDPNGAGSFLGNYAGTVQGTVADKIEGDTYDEEGNLIEDGGWLRKGLSMGYQGLMSAAESSVRALLFGGAAGGAAVAAADTFVDGVNEAMASGATQGQATSIGLAKAMVEFITEKIPMDRLTDLIKGGGKSLLRNMAAQAGEEATTEVASYAASILAEWGILREKSGYQQKIAKYILDGVNPEEAKKLVDREVLNEATETAIVSGFAGALGGISGTYIGNKVEENAQGDLEQVIQPEESQPSDQQGESPLSVQQDPVGQGTESAPVMPEEAASAPETRELDVVTQAVQQAQQNREAAQNAQQEPTLAQQLTPEQRVQEALKGVHKKEADAVQQEAAAQAAAWRGELAQETAEAEQLAVDRADSLAKEEAPPPDLYEQKPAMGAAEQNFTGKAAYADLLQEGNVQRDRPGDVRPVEVPKKDGAGRRVTEFAGNAYGAKATPDYMANEIESLIQDGKLGFDTRSNQESLRRAADALEGNTEGVKAQISENLAHDKVQDGDIEKAMLLYVKNANSKDKADQEAAAQILVQLGKMANITGRNLQLLGMLRRMTPEGQLLYAEKSARSMVEGLNKNRSVNKKIVSRRKEQAESAVKAVEQAKKQAGSAVARNSEKVREALTKYAKGESSDKKPVQAAIRAALKDIGETLDKLARSGEKTKAATGTEIVKLLTKKYGFDQADASHVADVVKAEYQRMVREKSKKILAQSFKERKPREQKTSDQIFDELANLGAFDADSEFNQVAAEKWLKTKDTYIEPELAKAYLDAKTDDEKEAALDNIYKDVASRIPATLGEKWDAWRNVAMLLNPKTHIRNMGATGSFLPFVEVKRVIGAALEKKLLDEEQRTKAVLGSDKRSKALLKWAKEDAKKPKVIERLGQSGTTGDNARSKIQEHRQILPGIMDKRYKGNMAVMEAEDRFFKRITYARSLASFLKARGYSETDIQGGLVPAGVLEEGRTLAIQEAQKATFNDRNAFSDTIAKLGRGADKIPVIGKVISKGALPFLRTPANVVARAWDYSPMKLAETFYQVRKGNVDSATAIDQVSSSLTGTAAMALGAALAAGIVPDVELVGKIEDEDEKESGATEYSLRIGNKYYSVSWLSPTMIPLFIGANLYDKFQALGEEDGMDGWDVAQAFMEVGADALDPMLELSMLSSLNDMLDAAADEDDAGGKAIALFLNAATSYFTQGLPTIFGQAEQATETEKSSTYVNTDNKVEKVIKKALGNASRRIPGIDLFQMPRLDEFGQVVKNEGDGLERAFNAFLNPFNVSQKKTDPISQELSRLRKAGAENASIPLPQRTISYTDTDGEKHTDVRLSQEQFQKLAEKQGQTEQAVLSALLDSDDFRAMSDEVKDDVLAIVHSYAKETGELAAVENHLGYSATWMEELAEADDPAKYIVQRVAGTNLNRAMTDLDTAWDHSWNTTAKERALDEAYAEYKSMSKEAQKEIETFATGTAKKYLEARGNGISHKDFLAAAKNVETVKGTGKYNSETKKNTVKDIDKREAIAKTTGLTEHQVDIIMKAYMPDYDPDAEKKEKTELKYDYIRQELGMTPAEYADTYRAYLENAKKHEKIAAIQGLGYDYTTASKLYRLYQGRIDVVAWAGK